MLGTPASCAWGSWPDQGWAFWPSAVPNMQPSCGCSAEATPHAQPFRVLSLPLILPGLSLSPRLHSHSTSSTTKASVNPAALLALQMYCPESC